MEFLQRDVVVQQYGSQAGHRREVLESRQELPVPHLVSQVPQIVQGVALRYQLRRKDAKLTPQEGGAGGKYVCFPLKAPSDLRV